MSGERIDFFVSHAGADRAWAEWVAWQQPANWTRTPWARRRRVLGEDHPETRRSANNLAADLQALGETPADADG